MKKIVEKIFIIMLCATCTLFIKNSNVKAVAYNGGTNIPGNGLTSGICDFKNEDQMCPWGNGDHKTVKLTVYYINNGEFTKVGKSVYWTTKNSLVGGDVLKVPDAIFNGSSSWNDVGKALVSYFQLSRTEHQKEVTPKMSSFFESVIGKNWRSEFVAHNNNLNPISQQQCINNNCSPATYGYRIIIEPVHSYKLANGTFRLFTVKEIAEAGTKGKYNMCTVGGTGNESCSNAFGGYTNGNPGLAAAFVVDHKDVGIDSADVNVCKVTSNGGIKAFNEKVANKKNGCGYHIIDITDAVENPKCYEMVKTGNPLKCTNTDQNNIETYETKYKEKNCTVEEAKKNTNSKYGKLIKSVPGSRIAGTTCKIYCKEEGTASLPGNVSSIGVLYPNGPFTENTKNGIFFAWPSKTPNSTYAMKMETKYTCRIKVEGANCSKTDLEKLLIAAKEEVKSKNHSAILTAGNNDEIHDDLKKTSETKGDQTVEDLLTGKLDYSKDESFGGWHNENDLVSKELHFTKTTNFYIEETKNRYVSKTTGKVVKKSDGNYFDRGQGVVSFAHDTALTQDKGKFGIFNLKLSDLEMGIFTKNDITENNQYVCKYRMKADDCTCPSGTFAAGLKLYHGESTDLTNEKVKDYRDGKLTCAELQKTECSKVVCKDVDGNNQDLTDCMKKELNIEKNKKYTAEELNKAYNTCSKQKKCDLPPKCKHPKTGEIIDTQSCVEERIEQGNTRSEAIIYCEKKMCNMCTDSKGDKHDLSSCLDEKIKNGTTYDMALEECTVKYCPPPCKQCVKGCCEALTTDCKWQITSDSKELVRFDKICDYSDTSKFKPGYIGTKNSCTNDCATVSFSCANGQYMNNLKSCSVNGIKLNDTATLLKQLQEGKLSINDISDAFNDCSTVACGGKVDVKKAVYRTIDLNTPFPSNGKTVYNGFSNVGTSRKPGSNWNSTLLVKDQILNARNAKGYELYNKEPLYVITLDSKTIKEIRAYNKENSYSDLKMNCTYKDESKCLSTFLHEKLNSAITGGKCKNMEQSSVGFDKCYESNN